MVNILDREQRILSGIHEIPIYYEDTDLSGFVYHANYLKFFERAREHLIGIKFLKDLWHDGIHFVVAETNQKFLRPVHHGDTLRVKSEISYSQSPVLECRHSATVLGAETTQTVEAMVKLVTLNRANRPIRLPDIVIEHFMSQQTKYKGE